MIIFITGQPGAGKTLRVMQLLRDDEQFAGRPVYTNVNGDRYPMIEDNDWRKCPDGSVVVIDEGQFWFPQRKSGVAIPEQVSAMDTHRHRGIDIIITTQRPTGVDHHVRGLVGRHEHLKSFTKSTSTMWYKNEAWNPLDVKERKDDAVESKVWQHPKDLYGTYASAVMHTHKFRIPKKVWIFIAAIVFAIAGGIFATAQVSSMVTADGVRDLSGQSDDLITDYNQSVSESQTVSTVELERLDQQSVTRLDGCVYRHRDDSCRCYMSDGSRPDYTYGQCVEQARGW